MDDPDFNVPRYRIEHRSFDMAALIVGYADTLAIGHIRLVRLRNRLVQDDAGGEVVLVDQDTEQLIERRSL